MDDAMNYFEEAMRAALNARDQAHALKIVERGKPIAEHASLVEDISEGYMRAMQQMSRLYRRFEKQELVEACGHPELLDDRLFKQDPMPTATRCVVCDALVCWACRHRVGQHGDLGCTVEGCDCSGSHK